MSEKAHTGRVRHHVVLTVVRGRAATRRAGEGEAQRHKRWTTWYQRQDRLFLSPLAAATHNAKIVTFTALAVLYNEFSCVF